MAYRNRLVTTISAVAAAGLGAFTVGPAQSGYVTFSAGDDGLAFDVSVVEGTAWEVRTGCVYTHSGTTLSRGTLESSSTGSAIAFTAAAVLTVTMAASTGDAIKALVSGGGNLNASRVVLIGDSMTDWYNGGGVNSTINSAIYTASTGILELTFAAAGLLYDGTPTYVWSSNSSYVGLLDQIPTNCVRVSTTVWRLDIGANLSGVPDATDIKTGLSLRFDVGRCMNSFVNWCQMLTGWRMHVVRNAAQSGARSASLLRRIDRDVLAYMPALCIGQAMGINDLGDPSPLTEAQIIADRTAIYEAIFAAGGSICEGSITPVGSAEPARATLNHMQSVLRLNDWQAQYARDSNARFATVDHYSTFSDPTNATGLALTSAVRNSDAIHPSTKSGISLGRQWAARIDDLVPWSDSTLPRSVIDCQAGSYLTISACSSTSDVVTVTAASHRYQVGDEIFVNNASNRAVNGRWVVETAAAGSFTFTVPGLGTVGSITSRRISRSRNIWSNPLFTTTSGGTNNMTAAGIVGTIPGGCALGGTPFGAATWVGTTGTRSAVNAAGSLLQQAPIGNEWYVDITTAPAATSYVDFTSAGTGTFGVNAGGAQIMLPNRSYVFEGVLCLRSTNWSTTPLRNILAQFTVADPSGWGLVAAGFSASDTAETNIISQDTRIHFRTSLIKTTVMPGQELNTASFLLRVQLDGAGFTGATLTAAISQIAVRDVTGDEDLYI